MKATRTPGILVTSGKGGVGKTLLATNIAVSLSQHMSVALVDADIRSPNLTYVMGIKNARLSLTPDRKISPFQYNDRLQVFSTDSLYSKPGNAKRAIMPTGEEVRALVSQSVHAVSWNNPDVFVFDSDPSTGDVFISLRDIFDGLLSAIVVTTNRISSLNDCERTIDALMINRIPLIGIVGNMIVDDHTEGIDGLINRCNARYHAEIRYLGSIPFDNSIADANDTGSPGLVGTPIISSILSAIFHREVKAWV